MKLRDEIIAEWGWNLPDEDVLYETDDSFVMKSGMGVNRNVEKFWRNCAEGVEQASQELPEGRDLRRAAEQVGQSFHSRGSRDKRTGS